MGASCSWCTSATHFNQSEEIIYVSSHAFAICLELVYARVSASEFLESFSPQLVYRIVDSLELVHGKVISCPISWFYSRSPPLQLLQLGVVYQFRSYAIIRNKDDLRAPKTP